MQEPVEAGALSTIGKFLGNVSKTLLGNLNKLVDYGLSVSKSQASDDGSFYLRVVTKKKNSMRVHCIPTPGAEGMYDLEFITDVGKARFKSMNVAEANISKAIGAAAKRLFEKDGGNIDQMWDESAQPAQSDEGSTPAEGETFEETAEASKRITLSLKKVMAGTEAEIRLVSVTANYEPREVIKDIDALVTQESFIDTLTETPQTYQVESNALDIIVPCDSEDEGQIFEFTTDTILEAQYRVFFGLQHAGWLNDTCNVKPYISQILDEIDSTVTMSRLHTNRVVHPAMICMRSDIYKDLTASDSIRVLCHDIQDLIYTYKLYYCNLSLEMQESTQKWIAAWLEACDYITRSYFGGVGEQRVLD